MSSHNREILSAPTASPQNTSGAHLAKGWADLGFPCCNWT